MGLFSWLKDAKADYMRILRQVEDANSGKASREQAKEDDWQWNPSEVVEYSMVSTFLLSAAMPDDPIVKKLASQDQPNSLHPPRLTVAEWIALRRKAADLARLLDPLHLALLHLRGESEKRQVQILLTRLEKALGTEYLYGTGNDPESREECLGSRLSYWWSLFQIDAEQQAEFHRPGEF